MTMSTDENSPLLGRRSYSDDEEASFPSDPHKQFCVLIGIPPSDLAKTTKNKRRADSKLYERARSKRTSQARTYTITAAVSNTLLLSQIVFGATLTALGASESSHVLITLFGVLNTIIAGLVAYLKSRGQPMRARMFRDDLDHVVNEIENSEIMWLGITKGAHGYDEIDIDDEVSVRSEVARLTRLYDRAVTNSTRNSPDSYMVGNVLDAITGLRARPGGDASGAAGTAEVPPVPDAAAPPAASTAAAPAAPAPAAPAPADPDASPASAKPKSAKPSTAASKDPAASTAQAASSSTPAAPAPAAAPAAPAAPAKSGDDADAEPATAPSKKNGADKSAQK